MIARIDSVRAGIRLRLGIICFTAVAISFTIARFVGSPASPMTTVQVAIAVLALGFVIFARNRSLVQRTTALIVLEVVGGIVAFAYVDVPVVLRHQTQIERVAVSLYDDVRRTH